MANPFNKLRLKSAAPNSSYFNLSCNHLTTCNFSQLRPTYYRELYLGDKFKVNMDVTAFTAPMVVPPMGVAHLKSRAFFVPYRLVWKYFNEFYSRKKINIGNTLYNPQLPYFTSTDLVENFLSFSSSSHGRDTITLVTPNNADDAADTSDIILQNSPGVYNTVLCYNFTAFGRQIYSIFKSLGYSWNWENYSNGVDLNALPILCFLRAYLDYYVPASFLQQNMITFMQKSCYHILLQKRSRHIII